MNDTQELWDFRASNGEGAIIARAWIPDSPLAVVQIAHGMSEHSGRYYDFARFLNAQGFAVVANDHAGHGLSLQGHKGAFATKAGGFDYSTNDLHRLFLHAEEHLGTLPRILFGHSMGSMMAALYAERYPGLTALIISGTPYGIPVSRLFQLLAGLIASMQGQLAASRILELLTGSAEKLPVGDAERARTWLTRDNEKVREFCIDPLCGFDYTAGGYHAFIQGYHAITTREWSRGIPDIPILVTGGSDDTASARGKGPRYYAGQLERTGHTQVELKVFDECRHEILNELNRDEVYGFLHNWLATSLATHKQADSFEFVDSEAKG